MLQSFIDQISNYVDKEISLEDLRFWIASNIQSLLEDPKSQESSYVAEIEGILMDAEEKDFSEDYIRDNISALIRPITVRISNFEPAVTAASLNSVTVYPDIEENSDLKAYQNVTAEFSALPVHTLYVTVSL